MCFAVTKTSFCSKLCISVFRKSLSTSKNLNSGMALTWKGGSLKSSLKFLMWLRILWSDVIVAHWAAHLLTLPALKSVPHTDMSIFGNCGGYSPTSGTSAVWSKGTSSCSLPCLSHLSLVAGLRGSGPGVAGLQTDTTEALVSGILHEIPSGLSGNEVMSI